MDAMATIYKAQLALDAPDSPVPAFLRPLARAILGERLLARALRAALVSPVRVGSVDYAPDPAAVTY